MNKIDNKILLLFLVYMTTNNKWDKEIETMKEKQREIKENEKGF